MNIVSPDICIFQPFLLATNEIKQLGETPLISAKINL